MASPVRQAFADRDHSPRGPIGIDGGAQHLLAQGRSIHLHDTVDELDPVAGQTDQALHIVGAPVARQLEHHDVPAPGRGGEQPPVKRPEAEGERMTAPAVRPFGEDQIVADPERGLHGVGRDGEGLEDQDADHQEDDQDVGNGPEILDGRPDAGCKRRHGWRLRAGGAPCAPLGPTLRSWDRSGQSDRRPDGWESCPDKADGGPEITAGSGAAMRRSPRTPPPWPRADAATASRPSLARGR